MNLVVDTRLPNLYFKKLLIVITYSLILGSQFIEIFANLNTLITIPKIVIKRPYFQKECQSFNPHKIKAWKARKI